MQKIQADCHQMYEVYKSELPEKFWKIFLEFVESGEWGLALSDLNSQIDEYDIMISKEFEIMLKKLISDCGMTV